MKERRISWKWVRRGLLLAAVVAFLIFHNHLPHLNLENAIRDLSSGLGAWTYLLVGGLAFLETGAFIGLIAPGEFTVLLGGAVAQQGDISLPVLIAVTWACAFGGDSASFLLGSKLGRSFMLRYGPKVRITKERLDQVDRYFQRYGGRTILIGRFIGLVRALAPFIAGSSKMRYREFAPFSILGTGLWSTGLILAGYFAASSLDAVTNAVGKGLLVFAIVVGVVVALIVAYRHLREPDNRRKLVAEMEKRPGLRQLLTLGRLLQPQFAFVGRRLTPGGLGLELTSLMAALSIGLFVLIAYWAVISGDPGPTPGDQMAINVANDLRTAWLDHVAEVVTYLGSPWVTWPLSAIAAAILAVRGRWMEFWALVVGMVAIILLVHGIKAWTDRPRPPDPVITAHGSSFPSGHAAYSTLYAWLAITVALRLMPSLARRSLLIAAGIALSGLIGLTRVYLRVHWLSDVSAGWALGVSCFSAVAVVLLVRAYIRDNPRRHERAAQLDPGAGAGAGH